MREDLGAVFMVKMLIQTKPRCRSGQQRCQRSLAHRERLTSKIFAIELYKVECVYESVPIMPLVTNAIEPRHSVLIADNRFPIDNAGPAAQPR